VCSEGNKVKLDNGHWYKHVPKLVERIPEEKVTLLWNQQVRTDRTIPNNKPDIIIGDNEKRNMYIKICCNFRMHEFDLERNPKGFKIQKPNNENGA